MFLESDIVKVIVFCGACFFVGFGGKGFYLWVKQHTGTLMKVVNALKEEKQSGTDGRSKDESN